MTPLLALQVGGVQIDRQFRDQPRTRVTPFTQSAADGSLYDYQCTKNSEVRVGLTILHFLVLLFVFLTLMLVALLLGAVAARRRAVRLRALPERHLPVFQDTISSLQLRRAITSGFARAMSDEICFGAIQGHDDDDSG